VVIIGPGRGRGVLAVRVELGLVSGVFDRGFGGLAGLVEVVPGAASDGLLGTQPTVPNAVSRGIVEVINKKRKVSTLAS